MENTDLFDYFQPEPIQQSNVNQMDQGIGNSSTLPSFSSLCSPSIESMLNALFPDDDTIKAHLDYSDTMDHSGNCDINSRLGSFDRFLENSTGYYEPLQPESCSPQRLYNLGYDAFPSSSDLNPLMAPAFVSSTSSSSFSSPCISPQNNSPPPSSRLSQKARSPSYQLSKGSMNVTEWPSSLRYPYTDSLSNYLPPLDPGFKPTITLNRHNSGQNEPWRSSVAKKILAAYYSPLSLKSEFLASQVSLDEFQSLVLKEAVAAFHDVAFCNSAATSSDVDMGPDSCPYKFVRTCTKVRAYRRLHQEDKVTLLSSVFFDTIAMKSIITYDHLTDSWNCSGKRVDRREVYRLDPALHNGIVNIIETFPDRWRKDITAATLIYLIIIFNPDLPNLKFQDSIRQEQYGYIYLLRRYLESVCESACDASDYHYRLMVKIEEIQALRNNLIDIFGAMQIGCVDNFQNRIASLVKYSIF